MLRLRSDEQLVSLFRAGHEDAFRVIHDRYRTRMLAYTRQMLSGSPADAEDAVQEIFVRAYSGLRTHDRELALRAWLYRIAHNRCIDEIRRPQAIAIEAIEEFAATAAPDPAARVEQRDALRRLIADVRRLPEQQRSALLMRELGGMSYAGVSEALGVSVPAVKSLLVRARVGLAQAGEARDTACERIREDLIVSHDRGVRTSGLARRHMRDCPNCRKFRSEVRGVSRQFAALVPALGPIGVIAKLLGVGSASSGGAGAVATSGAAAGGTTGAAASVGAIAAGAGHVVTLIAAAAVVTAGGAIELQRLSPPVAQHAHHRRIVQSAPRLGDPDARDTPAVSVSPAVAAPTSPAPMASAQAVAAPATRPTPTGTAVVSASSQKGREAPAATKQPLPLSELIDPDNLDSYPVATSAPPSATTGSGSATAPSTPTSTPTTGSQPTGTVTPGGPTTSTGTLSTAPTTVATSPSGASGTTSTTGSGSSAGQPAGGVTNTLPGASTPAGSGSGGAAGAHGTSTSPGTATTYGSTGN